MLFLDRELNTFIDLKPPFDRKLSDRKLSLRPWTLDRKLIRDRKLILDIFSLTLLKANSFLTLY